MTVGIFVNFFWFCYLIFMKCVLIIFIFWIYGYGFIFIIKFDFLKIVLKVLGFILE